MVIKVGRDIEDVEGGTKDVLRFTTIQNHKTSHIKGYNFEHEVDELFWDMKVEGGQRLFHYKMTDTHAWDGFVKKARAEGGSIGGLITPKVPADYLLVLNGHPFLIECKASSSNAIDMDGGWLSGRAGLIKDHQDAFAIEFEKEGSGRYLYFICNYPNTIYVLTLLDRMKAGAWQDKAGYASMKWSEINPFASMTLTHNGRGSDSKWPYRELLAFLIAP